MQTSVGLGLHIGRVEALFLQEAPGLYTLSKVLYHMKFFSAGRMCHFLPAVKPAAGL